MKLNEKCKWKDHGRDEANEEDEKGKSDKWKVIES